VDWAYAATPFAAWLAAGSLKFLINSVRARAWAFGLIGYGGLPSSHSAIVSSVAALVALKEGMSGPAFSVALAVALIVILDANGLRGQIGRHARAINRLTSGDGSHRALRERVGHTWTEIAAGVLLGIAVASGVYVLSR